MLTQDQQDQLSHLKEMFPEKEEELDFRLSLMVEETSTGAMVKHPLVFSMLPDPRYNHMLNQQLQSKLESLEEAKLEKDFYSCVFLHERPYRIATLLSLAKHMETETYWNLVRAVWEDSENMWQYKRYIRKLFYPQHWSKKLTGLELIDIYGYKWNDHLMDKEELKYLCTLPDDVTIYRGYCHHNKRGWSWTLSPSKARWFAKRFDDMGGTHQPMVAVATVKREMIIAYIAGRGESEIIVDPKMLEEIKSVPIDKLYTEVKE